MPINPDKIEIRNISWQSHVKPGATASVSFNLKAFENLLLTFDPDYCFAQNLNDGVRVDVEFLNNGQRITKQRYCTPVFDSSWQKNWDGRLYTYQYQAPTVEGAYSFTINVSRKSDGLVVASETRSYVVDSDADDPVSCPPGSYLNDEGNCVPIPDPDNGGDGDPNSPGEILGSVQNILLLLLILLIANEVRKIL